MADKGRDRNATDQEKSEKGHKDKIMGRAATIMKRCSTKNGEETLRNFYFFLMMLHTALGGAKAQQQQVSRNKHRKIEEDRGETEKNIRQRTENFLFSIIFSPKHHGTAQGHSSSNNNS